MAANATTDFVAKHGGVMTDEVGVVTGELTLRTEVDDQGAVQRVQYKDAGRVVRARPALTAALPTGQNIDGLHALTV